ncbi:hypothetical protein ACKTEK_10720 [Tepidamorphus sp. 3E244]|uniref:hypothetical protein n=1 Tax=Tepidamorphus sp. 3E244 TaxID=3385498 RepID=UPI0038FBE921
MLAIARLMHGFAKRGLAALMVVAVLGLGMPGVAGNAAASAAESAKDGKPCDVERALIAAHGNEFSLALESVPLAPVEDDSKHQLRSGKAHCSSHCTVDAPAIVAFVSSIMFGGWDFVSHEVRLPDGISHAQQPKPPRVAA